MGEMGLTHHISTGFLRAAIDGFLPNKEAELLRKHAFDAYELLDGYSSSEPPNILEGTKAQTQILKPVMEVCISRAKREGIGLIMEGSHFIPGVIDPIEMGVDLLCVLDVPDRQELKARAMSSNHLHRKLSEWDQQRLVMLQDQLLTLANLHKKPVVTNVNLAEAVQEVSTLVANMSEISDNYADLRQPEP